MPVAQINTGIKRTVTTPSITRVAKIGERALLLRANLIFLLDAGLSLDLFLFFSNLMTLTL